MTKEDKIKKFIEAGAKRWEKNGMDRLYINSKALGYDWDYYKSGNICYASDPNGDKISHSQMYRVLAGKIWLDVNKLIFTTTAAVKMSLLRRSLLEH